MANSDIRTGAPSFNATRTRKQAFMNCTEYADRCIAEYETAERTLIGTLLSTIPESWYNTGKSTVAKNGRKTLSYPMEYVIQCVFKTLGRWGGVERADSGFRSDMMVDSFETAKATFNPEMGVNFGSYWGNGLKLKMKTYARRQRRMVRVEGFSEGGQESNGMDIVAFKSGICQAATDVVNPSEEIAKAISHLESKGLRADIWVEVEANDRSQKDLARELDIDPATLNRHLQKCREAIREYAESRV